VPLCSPQIPHELTWDRTWASAVGDRRLTAWAIARPHYMFTSNGKTRILLSNDILRRPIRSCQSNKM
jgi:hypothetical protein